MRAPGPSHSSASQWHEFRKGAGVTREGRGGGQGWALSWEQGGGLTSRLEQSLEAGMGMALQRTQDLGLLGAKDLF